MLFLTVESLASGGALPALICQWSGGWVMANVVIAEGIRALTLPFSCFYVEMFICERLGSVTP